ncbi:fibrinogen-like YCDxxxxGGGW domain-containing protein [Sulfurimonas sp.]|uniref:fibrinogen-like YCDxxxxGGGW domain-containing protein n=1 Tax=Sulfurimonas sp. TaxID=2022749 RepID=UPI0025EEB75F|nr:fibrinogen-like YCDxxxxGGGW domain-containing protein [Sulfurimonas sp.]MDD5157714.1 fibrinogen-like YCDxxxxGGGW domain-containing protein [Sulfurimonas sp.]
MIKIVTLVMSLYILVGASDYSRANAASKEALKGLDCEYGDCPKVEEKIVEKPVIIFVEKPVVVEKVIVKEKIVDRPVYIEQEEKPVSKKKFSRDTAVVKSGYSSCAEIKESFPESKSGYFDIIIDNTDNKVYCEMSIAGGGWTRVWQATDKNYNQPQYDYDVSYSFTEQSSQTMISFDNNGRQISPYYFSTPAEWKVQHPMAYNRGESTVEAIDAYTNKSYRNRKVYYGFEQFSSRCTDNFYNGKYGKVCIASTEAPFYSGFNTSYEDYCSTSNKNYSEVSCGNMRFSIFMR